jgi:hypothetical protein
MSKSRLARFIICGRTGRIFETVEMVEYSVSWCHGRIKAPLGKDRGFVLYKGTPFTQETFQRLGEFSKANIGLNGNSMAVDVTTLSFCRLSSFPFTSSRT